MRTAVAQIEAQLRAAADDGELVVAVTRPPGFCGPAKARSCAGVPRA